MNATKALWIQGWHCVATTMTWKWFLQSRPTLVSETGSALCFLQTTTEKHRMSFPETVDEILDVSEDEGRAQWDCYLNNCWLITYVMYNRTMLESVCKTFFASCLFRNCSANIRYECLVVQQLSLIVVWLHFDFTVSIWASLPLRLSPSSVTFCHAVNVSGTPLENPALLFNHSFTGPVCDFW